MALIIVGVVLVIIILWFISAQRKLVAMDENINNAMGQIGVQLSSRWDALTALLDLTKGYADHADRGNGQDHGSCRKLSGAESK